MKNNEKNNIKHNKKNSNKNNVPDRKSINNSTENIPLVFVYI